MKKILSVILAVVMLSSMAFSVTAAEPTVNEILTGISFPNTSNLQLSVDVEAKETSASEYAASPLSVTLSGGSASVDYKSTLDMTAVRTLFTSYTVNNLLATAQTDFDAGTVETSVTVTIIYPAGATFVGSLDTIGTLNAPGMSFTQSSRAVDTTNHKVTINYVNNGTHTVSEIRSNVNAKLADISFVLDDEVTYNAAGSYNVEVSMTGSSIIRFGSGWVQTVNYLPASATHTTTVSAPYTPPAGGGGGGVASYTITYETNGGSRISPESYAQGKTVKLTSVPVKEGYIFEGWYLDEALTEKVTEFKMTENVVVYAKWVEDNGAGSAHEIPAMLNGEDHFAYVVGYPDGTVRPNANITRAEVTSIFFRLLKEEVREANLTTENNFSDVNEGEWYNTAISTMAKLGIINGKGDGKFVPNTPITRAEFAVICARFDDSEYEVKDTFTDIAGHWAEAEIHEAAAYGWIRGYEDNTFKPNKLITRAEAMTMINRMVKRAPEFVHDMLDSMTKWPDNSDQSAWYYIAVQEATNSHDHDRKNDIYETWTESKDSHDWTQY